MRDTEKTVLLLEFGAIMHEEAPAMNNAAIVRLCQISARLLRLETIACNENVGERAAERNREEADKLRKEAVQLLHGYENVTELETHMDPRSNSGLRIHFKSKRYNNMGGEGWNVPTL